MQRILAAVVFGILLAPLTVSAITIDTVPVGNPGNANDPSDGDRYTIGDQNFGAVNYVYRIGETEVTNTQYVEFLNAKAASDPLDLYNPEMANDPIGGITRNGVEGSFTYATKANMGNKPVNYVNWFDAIRFTNWLANGQGSGDTENGAYTLLGGTYFPSNFNSITRNAGATWFLPSENEWYKAAYHQPAVQGGDTDDYWLYPTASNSPPLGALANSVGDILNPVVKRANYDYYADWNGQNGNVTTVGSAGPLSKSFYGTSDQAGNVMEWTEEIKPSGVDRGLRGGDWGAPEIVLQSSGDAGIVALFESYGVGFRVATVPEPSTLALAALGALGLLIAARRRL